MAKIDGIVDDMVNYVSPADGDAMCATWRGKPMTIGTLSLPRQEPTTPVRTVEQDVRERMQKHLEASVDPKRVSGDITFPLNGPRKPQQSVTAAPRPGQTWRSPTGEEGRIYDHTHEPYTDVWHLRMTSGLRVREEHADLVTAWSYVSGSTEPETPRERFDRVGALMVADRPEGVTERTWQAVVMAMGEGEDENGMRQKCASARVALAVAERMRVLS